MTRQTIERAPGGSKASKPTKSVSAKTVKRTGGKGAAGRTGNGGRRAGNTKTQLVALLPRKGVSRKGGARLSVISERFGWQAHTVRAAISGLRKQGFRIETSKAPHPKNAKKSSATGETVYAINASSGVKDTSSNGAAR